MIARAGEISGPPHEKVLRRGVGSNVEDEVGGKAAGLASLPGLWTPPFVVFGASFRALWRSQGSVKSALDTDESLRRKLAALIANSAPTDVGPPRILVRSNGPGERRYPGEAVTAPVPADLAALEPALERALSAFSGSFPLVQTAIEPGVLGLMSNERRWSTRRDTWLVEGSFALRGPEITRLRATETTDEHRTLRASTARGLLSCLRRVAGLLRARGGEWRVEWIWDGERVWVVQADQIEPPRTDQVAARYLRSRDRHTPAIRRGAIDGLRGPKLDAWRRFRDLGWPSYPLVALSGDEWQRLHGASAYAHWVREFGKALLVIRTDVVSKHRRADLLLPTSAPSSDPKTLAEFMTNAAAAFRERNVPDHDWMFLISPVVRARASALARAYPGGSSVDLDALWGFPDGLLHLPYDSCRVDRLASSHYSRRHKPLCLLAEEGGWNLRPVPAPLDWSPVLLQAEAVQIASWAQQLADGSDEPVMLMALARIGGRRGEGACLPFFATSAKTASPALAGKGIDDARGYSRISSPADLAELRARSDRPAGIDLRPSVRWIRDAQFLRAIAEYSAETRLPVAFYGSLLGHASYILRSHGAIVVIIAGPSDTTTRTRYDRAHAFWPLVVRNSDGLARVEAVARDVARAALERQIATVANLRTDSVNAMALARDRNRASLNALTSGRSVPRNPGRQFTRLGVIDATMLDRQSLAPDTPGVAAGFMRSPPEDVNAAESHA